MQTQETKNTSNQSCLAAIREGGAVTTQGDVNTEYTCKIQFYIILALTISILGLVIFCTSTL